MAPAALCLLSTPPASALSLFGFGSSSDSAATEEARARAVALIRENAAGDEFIPPASGVGRRDAARFAAARAAGKLVCTSSSGAGASTEISWDKINDNFCDCPHDGSDEPGTSACSNGVFECANRGHRSVRLPSSRVGDGVCDCCDGSDEPEGACKASCEEASEEWVAGLADRVVKVEQGTARRVGYAEAAVEAAAVRTQEIEDVRLVTEGARDKLAQAKEALKALEEQETQQKNDKLAEAEKAVSERTRGVLEDPERLAALAIAVASADEPSVTLETLCRSVLDGVDVGVALKDLLDEGKKKDKDGSKKKGVPDAGEEDTVDAFLSAEDEDLEAGYDDHFGGLGGYEDMMLDDDYMGYYGGGYDYGGGYGGDFGDAYEDDARFGGAAGGGAGGEANPVPKVDSHAGVEGGGDREGNGDGGSPKVALDASDGGGNREVAAGEGKEEESEQPEASEPKKKAAPFKPPREFKTFKFETPEAVEGRKEVKSLSDGLKVQEKKLKTLEQEDSEDYGEDGALWPLKDKCITTKTGGYEYRVCPFKDAHQEEGKSKTLIGKWKGIEKAQADDMRQLQQQHQQLVLSGDVLVFDRGQKCWNGPARSLRVALACGTEDSLSAVTEPETCTYEAVLETPGACSSAQRHALIASVAGGAGEGLRRDDGAGVRDEL
ncbi:unnamed protein product [Ectocarpus sp. 13 AM-2016]